MVIGALEWGGRHAPILEGGWRHEDKSLNEWMASAGVWPAPIFVGGFIVNVDMPICLQIVSGFHHEQTGLV